MGAFVQSFPCLASSRHCPQPEPAAQQPLVRMEAAPSPNPPSPGWLGPMALNLSFPVWEAVGGLAPTVYMQAGKLMPRDTAERLLTLSCYRKSSASPVET